MAVLEIATFWAGELLSLDYVKEAPEELRVPGWTHDGAVSTHTAWVPDAERLGRKSAPWGELASAFVVAAVIHVGLLGLGLWVHDADPGDGPPNVRTLGTLAGDVEPVGGGAQENSGSPTPTPATEPARLIGKGPSSGEGLEAERLGDTLETASSFGIIRLMGGAGVGRDSAWGLGPSDVNVSGSLFGGGSVPSLGPELTGIGQGGGGPGMGIGLGGIGTIGATCDDACIGTGYGYGSAHGRLSGHHATIVCHLPAMLTTTVDHLPSEVIQRIVRMNMGRFRGCYEDGLSRNPSLAGRVQVKFMIGRDGSVSSAQDSGSTLADASVVACIVRAYQTIEFPASGAPVGVTYPLELTPD